jgi:hypothetical protein
MLTCGSVASAADARLQRVLVLPAADRASVVFELTGEPLRVSTRRISDSVVEVEAGPGIEAIAPQLLKAPANVRFIESVAVSTAAGEGGSVVRARIALSSAAQAAVRSSGRRVYVDFSAAAVPLAPAAGPAAARTAAAAPAAKPAAIAPPDPYRAALRPVIDKLHDLLPFTLSAANSANPQVLTAMGPQVAAVRSSLAVLQPPDPMRGSQAMLLSAVDGIAAALAPDYRGDRAATVRQSTTTIDVVGAAMLTGDLQK